MPVLTFLLSAMSIVVLFWIIIFMLKLLDYKVNEFGFNKLPTSKCV